MVVTGATRSTVNDWPAGLASVLPAASVARTWKLWTPAVRSFSTTGDTHADHVTAPSTRQVTVDEGSLDANAKVAVVRRVRLPGAWVIVVSGAATSTVKAREDAVACVLPAGSVARTWKVCAPAGRPANVLGEVHAANGAPSIRHANVDPASALANVNAAVVEATGPDGPLWITAAVGVVSTVKVRSSGEGSVFQAGSEARTANVCGPSAMPVSAFGDEQEAHAPPSRRHSNVAVPSSLENVKLAPDDPSRPDGPVLTAVSGVTVSTVNVRLGGCSSTTFPLASAPRTVNVCGPSASADSGTGEVHGAHSAPSTRQVNVDPALREGSRRSSDRLRGWLAVDGRGRRWRLVPRQQ